MTVRPPSRASSSGSTRGWCSRSADACSRTRPRQRTPCSRRSSPPIDPCSPGASRGEADVWLAAIARNECLDRIRARMREPLARARAKRPFRGTGRARRADRRRGAPRAQPVDRAASRRSSARRCCSTSSAACRTRRSQPRSECRSPRSGRCSSGPGGACARRSGADTPFCRCRRSGTRAPNCSRAGRRSRSLRSRWSRRSAAEPSRSG